MNMTLPIVSVPWLCAVLILVSWPGTSHGVLWHSDSKQTFTAPPTEVMRNAVSLHYTFLNVFGGSGVLLDSTHVLTAKHAAKDWAPGQIRVGIGSMRYRVTRISSHPDQRVDLAILYLDQPVKEFETLQPDPIRLADQPPVPGEQVWLGGFGMSGPLGSASSAGKFASGFNRITSVDSHRGKIRFDPPTDPNAEPKEAFPAMFDSGSPVFVQRDHQWILSGITVTVSNRVSPGYGNHSHHELVSPAKTWIMEQLK